MKKTLFLALTMVAHPLIALLNAASAQTYPTRPIRMIVPFGPGGGTDTIAREVTARLSSELGWKFIVENKSGAGGNLGIDTVAKATADGYTLGLGQTSNLSINPTLYASIPYDSLKDLAPVIYVASAPLLMVVAADSPLKTLADVISVSKAKPRSLNFASPGNGTVTHLAGELLQKTADFKLTHIPYRNSSLATTDLIGGQVQIFMASVPTLIGYVRSGKLRALAVTSLQRVDDLPAVPTVSESGYKGFEATTWFGVVAPANTPKEILAQLSLQINKVLQGPELRTKFSEQGALAQGGSQEVFGKQIRSELQRWAPIVKETGARLD